MSGVLQAANVDIDSAQIVYASNTVTLKSGGVNVAVVNATSVNYLLPVLGVVTYATTGNTTANSLNITSNGGIITSQINFNGNVTPAAINANTAAFSPPVANTTIVRFSANSSNNSALSIYGMTAGTNGQIVVLSNIGTKAIRISNEDITNESTAGNRFSLPQEILLNGYQSMTVYYDGISARWKPIDTSYISFYKGLLTKGFNTGGVTPVVVSTADRTTYSTETVAAVTGANLSGIRYRHAGAGNICKGFFMGGTTPVAPTILATADRTTFPSEITAAVTGANLPAIKSCSAGAGNICKGFFAGGTNSPGVHVSTTDRITYSTEITAAVTGAALIQARSTFGATGNACKGFFAGGANPTSLTTTERVTYSTETNAAVPGASLSQDRRWFTAAGNQCKGFISGGCSSVVPARLSSTERVTYSTETNAAVPGANMTVCKSDFSASGNQCKGFFAGGFPALARNCRITYSTETTAFVPGANLSLSRRGLFSL